MALNGAEGDRGHGNRYARWRSFPEKHQPLFDYFKQLFAQVTNPPIDAIREEIVTSTTIYVGKDGKCAGGEGGKLQDAAQSINPILTNTDLLKIKNMKVDGFKVEVIPIIYYKNTTLEKAIDHLYVEADRAYPGGRQYPDPVRPGSG